MDANVTFVHKQTKCYIGEDEIVTSDHMHRHLVKRDEQQEVCSGDTCRNGIVKMEDEIIPTDHKRRILIQRDGFPAQDPQVVSLKEIIKQQVELAIGDISKDVVKSISILIGSGSVPFSCDTLSKVSVKVGIGEEHSVFIQNEGERLLLAVPVSDNIEMVCSSGIQIPMELIVTDGSYKMYASKYGLQKGMLNYTIDWFMDDVKVYGPLRSGTTDRTLAYAEEILNSETGNKVNVDLRRTKESVDNQLIWH